MAEETQDFRPVLPEEIDGAAESTEFRFNLLKSRGRGMLHRIQSQMHLFDIATDRGCRGFELRFRRQSRHPLLDSVEAIVDRFDSTGDKANQVFVRLGQ